MWFPGREAIAGATIVSRFFGNQIVIEPERIDYPLARMVYDYWLSLCHDGRHPGWADFDLMAIYKAAPFMTVKDVEDADGIPQPLLRNRAARGVGLRRHRQTIERELLRRRP